MKTYLRNSSKHQEKEQGQNKRRKETSQKEDREKDMTEQRLQPKHMAEQELEPKCPPKPALRGGTLTGPSEPQDTDPICCTALASPKGRSVVLARTKKCVCGEVSLTCR